MKENSPLDGASGASGGRADPVPPPAVGGLRRAVRLLLLHGPIARAAQQAQSVPAHQRQLRERAEHAFEAAERLRDPVDPLRTGRGDDVAISLYREAVVWALRAHGHEVTPSASLAQTDFLHGLDLAGEGNESVERAKEVLCQSFLDTAELAPEQRARDAVLLARVAHALVDGLVAPSRRLRRLQLARGFLAAIYVVLVASMVVVPSYVLLDRAFQEPNLAQGKPWRASSTYAGYDATSHVTDGRKTRLFFHTTEEKNPWVEYDLQAPVRVHSVKIWNRRDCCPGRATPLVVEVSVDQKEWKEVARREAEFGTWSAKFAPVETRYVRARALKKTWLHFERVEVY